MELLCREAHWDLEKFRTLLYLPLLREREASTYLETAEFLVYANYFVDFPRVIFFKICVISNLDRFKLFIIQILFSKF